MQNQRTFAPAALVTASAVGFSLSNEPNSRMQMHSCPPLRPPQHFSQPAVSSATNVSCFRCEWPPPSSPLPTPKPDPRPKTRCTTSRHRRFFDVQLSLPSRTPLHARRLYLVELSFLFLLSADDYASRCRPCRCRRCRLCCQHGVIPNSASVLN